MKKLIALLLALTMVFSVACVFAGCEDDSKKNSKVEEEEEEEKDDDETTAPEGDETTAPEGDETTAPEGDDPTDPEPTDPEPTDPEPTEDDVTGELMDAPDIVFDENIKVLALMVEMNDGGEITTVEVGLQDLSDEEGYFYYCDESINALYYVNGTTFVKYSYDEASETYIEDTSADTQALAVEIMGAASVIAMFTSPADMMPGAQYEKLGVEEIDGYGEVAAYNVYIDGELTNTLYIQVETGLTLNIADAEGNNIAYVTFVTQDIDFSTLIG